MLLTKRSREETLQNHLTAAIQCTGIGFSNKNESSCVNPSNQCNHHGNASVTGQHGTRRSITSLLFISYLNKENAAFSWSTYSQNSVRTRVSGICTIHHTCYLHFWIVCRTPNFVCARPFLALPSQHSWNVYYVQLGREFDWSHIGRYQCQTTISRHNKGLT